ncbi:hypothetical protein D1007_44665 [Hordeum vulgare]|nr:hypothetical protein D1007_44665 [Hordeum vulgare]
MANIVELNIEGVMSWQYTKKLQRRLPYLQRLRIIKPPRQANNTSVDINESFRDKTKLEILDLSGNNDMENLPTSLSMASKLEVLVLDGCDGIENVILTNYSLRSFSFDAYGAASQWTSDIELLPPKRSRPKHPSADVVKKDVKTFKISLEGCTQLENVFLRGLPNLVELDLSGCAIKILDLRTMVMDVPNLRRLFLLGCEHLRSIRWGSDVETPKLELLCIDTRPWPGRALQPSIVQHKTFRLQVHAIIADARLARSLHWLIYYARNCVNYFNISITSISVVVVAQPEEPSSGNVVVAKLYGGICNEVGLIWDFPEPPTSKSDSHIEIGDGSCSVESELQLFRFDTLRYLMTELAESLHVHDASIRGSAMPPGFVWRLRWCRVERCPNLDTVFPFGGNEYTTAGGPFLETIWASDLLMARSIWTRGFGQDYNFTILQHLHLHSCPSLEYAVPVCTVDNSFPNLKTLYIIRCSDLVHIFVQTIKKHPPSSVQFPKLTTVHLHDLPSLQQMCEAAETLAPALEKTRIRGCWSLRRLPALKGREPGMRRPTVGIEKDVWDGLEWGGVESGHHPSLYEAPVQSRYHKRPMPRGTVLR